MSDRAVRKTDKDQDGDITSLCSDGDWWSPRARADAIADIENGIHTYHVPWPEGRTEIRVVNGPRGKYLRTDRDDTTRNNLDDLPDCRGPHDRSRGVSMSGPSSCRQPG